MLSKNVVCIALSLFGGILSSSLSAAPAPSTMGIVNFATCATESSQGKFEQEQLESLRKQWMSLIEETDKELASLSEKLKDQDYVDSLSPEALTEHNTKLQVLSEDMAKYQHQFSNLANQANYLFIQKLFASVSKASETVATNKNLEVVVNKEACFYNNPKIDVTSDVIKIMNETFDKEKASKKTEPLEFPNIEPKAKSEPTTPAAPAKKEESSVKKAEGLNSSVDKARSPTTEKKAHK